MENLPESPFSDAISSSSMSSPSLCDIFSTLYAPVVANKNPLDLSILTPNQLVLLLRDTNIREKAIDQLIKKLDGCKDLALILWNTFSSVYILLLDVMTLYGKLSPSMLSMRESTRACKTLALFQVLAENPETRKRVIKAKIPCYFYPFLKPSGNDKPLEYLRLTSLGVLGSLAEFDDPNGPMALHFFLETEVVPMCLACMEQCDEVSRKVATLIIMKILKQERGMAYCCDGADRFYSIVQVLYKVVEKLVEKPSLLHLKYVIQCYLSFSGVPRFAWPSDKLRNQVPPQLFDNTFKDIICVDYETSWTLELLHYNIYGCPYSSPVEDSKNIKNKDKTVRKGKRKW